MRKIAWILIAVAVLFAGCAESTAQNDSEPTKASKVVETSAPTEPPVVLGFLDELEYTPEQIEGMREVLTNVGITEIIELEIGNVVYGMQVIKGVAFTDGGLSAPKEVRVQFNIENGVIFLVAIHCPSYGTSNQPTYLSGLEDRRADLYYDAEGGYLKKIDWGAKEVVDY